MSWVSWWDVAGWTGSALLVWSLLQARILRLRAINLVGCLVLIGYNGALRVWPMVGLNATLAVINIVYLRGMLTTRHDERAYEVVEVGTGDGLLAHVLRVHGRDIARFNPGFRPDAATAGPGRYAFLVMRADEIVGVVLLRDAGNGVAQIELDYVTQRFRDFTPGEFVYGRSGLFTGRGFRRLITPPGMVAPYYGRVGFRPADEASAGGSYVLDLPAT